MKTMRPCPECGTTASVAADNPFRPFCSERCRLLDLGEWLTDGYAIAGREADEEELTEELAKLRK